MDNLEELQYGVSQTCACCQANSYSTHTPLLVKSLGPKHFELRLNNQFCQSALQPPSGKACEQAVYMLRALFHSFACVWGVNWGLLC